MDNSPGMCPRCGGNPIVQERDGYGAYVRCRYCGWQKSVGTQTDGLCTDLRLVAPRTKGLSTALPYRRGRRGEEGGKPWPTRTTK